MRRLYISLAIRSLGLVILCGLLYVALFPHTAAACGDWDFKCPVDVGLYSAVVSISEILWKINRMLLWAARWVEGLRVWLVTDVLGTALEATIAGVKFPFWIAAGVAWMVFVVSFLLQMVVQLNWVDLRRGLRNAAFAVILFQFGSQAMAGMEQVRVTVGQGFSNIAATSVGNAQQQLGFYAGSGSESRSDALDTPRPLYAGDPCGLGLRRDQPNVMFMNDYVAASLFANAQDIHCPAGAGYADVPVRYAEVFKIGDISNESDSGVRDQLIADARYGLARQAQAVLPAIGAVLEQVMHLVFALALASLWFGLVISLIFSLFVPLEGMFRNQIDGMIMTLRKSWMASFWVGLALALIGQAARSGNALVLNTISIGMFVVVYYQTRGALVVLRDSMSAAATSLGQAPAAVGGLARGFGRMAADGAIIGTAMATGNSAGLVEAGMQQMRRKLTFSTSGNLLAQAGERLLLNKAMGPVERWVQDEKEGRAISQREDEATWYEQRLKTPQLTAEQKGRALRRTDEIDKEIDTRAESTTKRNIQQARDTGAWARADKLQKQADEQEVSRLEAKLDEAQKSGDPKQIASIPKIQERIDSLRGVPSAAVDTANGTVGAAVGASGTRPASMAVGLQDVYVARATSGQLSVNGHAITRSQVSTDGHRVTLSAGDRAVDISRDDAAAANGLEVGKALTIQANVRDPNGDRAPTPHVGEDVDVRAELDLRIQEGQRQERVLMGQRDVAFEEHRFGDARKLGEQINALRTQMMTDRKTLASVDRAGTGVRVTAPALSTSAVALSPSAAPAGDLAYLPPPGTPLDERSGTPQERYEQEVSARRSYVEQSVQRLEGLQQQQAQLVAAGRPAQAALLDPQIAERQTFVRRNQEIYNQVAATPPAGGTPAPQIVVGEPGFVPVSGANTPVMLQASAAAQPTAALVAQPTAAPVGAQPMAQPTAAPVGAQSMAQPVMVQPTAVPVGAQPMAQPTAAPVGAQSMAQPVMVQPTAVPVGAQPVMVQPTAAPVSAAASVVQPAVQTVPVAAPATPVMVPAPPSVSAVLSQPAAPPMVMSVQQPNPSLVPPARSVEPSVPPATTPAPSNVPSGRGESWQASPSAAPTRPSAASAKPRLWKNRDRRRNGPHGGSGGTI